MTDTERKKFFSQNLISILRRSDKSQIEVANAIGVSQQTFNTWCRGVAIPRMGKIQLLADYFHVNMSELIEPQKTYSTDSSHYGLSDSEHELIDTFRSFNDEGQEKVLEYARLLDRDGSYIKNRK